MKICMSQSDNPHAKTHTHNMCNSFKTRIVSGVAGQHEVWADMPSDGGGQGDGPSPKDLAMAGLVRVCATHAHTSAHAQTQAQTQTLANAHACKYTYTHTHTTHTVARTRTRTHTHFRGGMHYYEYSCVTSHESSIHPLEITYPCVT